MQIEIIFLECYQRLTSFRARRAAPPYPRQPIEDRKRSGLLRLPDPGIALNEFIDENGGGPGVRLRKRPNKKAPREGA